MQFALFMALLIFPTSIYSDGVISPRPPAAALARRDGTPTTTSAAASATASLLCPPEDRVPNCSDCGSTQENGESSICTGPNWKGCPCVDGPTFADALDAPDPATSAVAPAAPTITSIVDLDPGDNMVHCAGEEKYNVFRVKDNIDAFCSKYDGQVVGPNINQEWYYNGDGNWIKFWIGTDKATCGTGQQKIEKKACLIAMFAVIKLCAAGPKTKGGTTGNYLCMNYGFYGADAAAAGKSECPDADGLLNLGQNPCDTKCHGAGYEECSTDLKAPKFTLENHGGSYKNYDTVRFSCHCKNTPTMDSPCAGMKCGDPIKMRDGPTKNGVPIYKPYRSKAGSMIIQGDRPPSIYACDVSCPKGNYFCDGLSKDRDQTWCKCTDAPSKNQKCVNAIAAYGFDGR